MISYKLIEPVNVHLPDGAMKVVTHAGDAIINKNIYLKDVLLVPGFTHNLIFVAQLIHDSVAKCVFLPTHCIVQGQEHDKILGVGKMIKNLYVIKGVVENYFCNLFDPRKMAARQWHIFLGQPSITTMKHIKGITERFTDDLVNELEQCEICMKAKQCRDPFPFFFLNKRTYSLFELENI